MKAARIQSFGGSEKVHIENVPVPKIKPGEALVRIKAAAVNPVDWMVREKLYNPEGMDRVPLTLGQDFAGIVEELAPGSRTSLHPGDAVFGLAWGSFAEYAAIPIKDLVPKPCSIDWITAASIPMPALTAWQMINNVAKANHGMKLLIHGASGGVGSFAAQFAKLKGAEVFATASRPSFEYLRSIGIDDIIDYRSEHFEKLCQDLDVVIDPLGGETQARSWGVLKKGGLLINLIGEIDEMTAKRLGRRGVAFAMRYDVKDLAKIGELVEQRKVYPHIVQIFPLEEARKALDINQRGQSHGKIVLKVG
jgi:NADPH:quinone reductase-like Zn-dependent oxidoreductase